LAAFFGRPADYVLKPPENSPDAPFVYRFPPLAGGFFKRLFSQANNVGVYITDGMARRPMNVPQAERPVFPERIELIAYAKEALVADNADAVAPVLQDLAMLPWLENVFFGPMHTCEWQGGLWPASSMAGFFFAVPDGIDMRRLCSCTEGAQLVVSVMPITLNEIAVAKNSGPLKLLEQFESQAVENHFDPFRNSVF
jgi:hypothetical protein